MSRVVLWILVALALPVWAARVEDLRVWHAPDQSRLVLDLSEAAEFEIFPINDPPRVVIDLRRSVLTKPLTMAPHPSGRVLGVRHAPLPNGQDLRIVLDLARGLRLKRALLPPHAPYGHRLVIDLLEHADRQEPPASPAPVTTPPASVPPVATSSPDTPPAPPGEAAPPAVAAQASAPALTPPTARKVAEREYVIAIDAGHGGEDVGAIGPRGTYEKTVVLAIARELAALIDQEPDMRAVLIREGDYYVGLRDRMVRARKHRADMFVSIHADAFRNRRVRGSSVYVLSHRGASSEAARWLAERENAADLVGGVALDDKDPQLRSVLLELSQSASLEASLSVAGNVLKSLQRVGTVHRRQVQAAGFMVLKSPDIPSLLVETAFISNPQEEQLLRDRRFRSRIAGAIRDGIKSYFRKGGMGARYAQGRRHMVTQGDTLSAIAERYAVSPAQILAANNRSDSTVRLGEVLLIP
ncbi:MAG: N-acetylmuramoyl-L-alanine amidase [Gammaproteobacteria bacterium]